MCCRVILQRGAGVPPKPLYLFNVLNTSHPTRENFFLMKIIFVKKLRAGSVPEFLVTDAVRIFLLEDVDF
jgi:hypothetical protein